MRPLTVPASFSLDQIPFPMVVGSYRLMRDCNAAYCELYGYDKEDLIGKSFSMIYTDRLDFIEKGNIFTRTMARSRTYTDERIMRRRDGSLFWCRVYGKSIDPRNSSACVLFCVETMNRPVAPAGKPLSTRQREVCALVAHGMTNAEIATKLGLSKRTVEAHRARLTRQVGVRNSAELVAWFSGWSTPDS
jgi:PAS domain S-box-containing protein